ncbi:MAG: hypothetical protein DCC88_00035 [Spirobacillus cienkowskii]|uniref:Ribbon-helix-helix protein, CopG family n=1 Tax=Spirobacillus cienkowskii TaxID=495820 RepID=A0A369KUA7_9BACT|nr:MAG: hypothetical protein DCC88_00035 [Spirobacillus cienkowskii]
MSLSNNTNNKLKESLKIKSISEEPQSQINYVNNSSNQEIKNHAQMESIVDELKELKKKQKKLRLEPVMTHLRSDVNQALEDLVEKTGLTKSKVVAQILMKGLGIK